MTLQNVSAASLDLKIYKIARRILSTKNEGSIGNCMTHGPDSPLGLVCVNDKAYLVCNVCAFTHITEAQRPLRNDGRPNNDAEEDDNPYCKHLRCYNLSNNQRCVWCDQPVCTVHSTIDNDEVVTCNECEDDLNKVV